MNQNTSRCKEFFWIPKFFFTLHKDAKLLDNNFLIMNLDQINCTKMCIEVQAHWKPTLFRTKGDRWEPTTYLLSKWDRHGFK